MNKLIYNKSNNNLFLLSLKAGNSSKTHCTINREHALCKQLPDPHSYSVAHLDCFLLGKDLVLRLSSGRMDSRETGPGSVPVLCAVRNITRNFQVDIWRLMLGGETEMEMAARLADILKMNEGIFMSARSGLLAACEGVGVGGQWVVVDVDKKCKVICH